MAFDGDSTEHDLDVENLLKKIEHRLAVMESILRVSYKPEEIELEQMIDEVKNGY
jgi:hypothetical protein